MIHQKELLLKNGRKAKVILHDLNLATTKGERLLSEIEVLVQDPSDRGFREPIGITHPKYWKARQAGELKSRLLQWEYSGMSKDDINNTIKELKKVLKTRLAPKQFSIFKEFKLLKAVRIRE